ncbi:hypothetical protein M0805_005300 [Coniferiporia weirii]|nr:hypothetical protein M0805_005300 [Coniferiporia weirii]
MPREGVAHLNQLSALLLLSADDPDEELVALLIAWMAQQSVQTVLCRPYNAIRLDDFLHKLIHLSSDHRFKAFLRMDQQSFKGLHNIIKDSDVFVSTGHKPQRLPWYQLAIFLLQYGTDPSIKTAEEASIAEGTVYLYCGCVVQALHNIHHLYILWPDSQHRASLKATMAEYGFPGCIGIVDGTLIPLANKPCVNGELYWCHKKFYMLAVQAICDHNLRFTQFEMGWPGNVQDTTVFRESDVWLKKVKYFEDNEYILADKGSFTSYSCMVEVHAQINVQLCNYYGMHPLDCDAPSPQYPGESFLSSLPSALASTLLVCGNFNRCHHSWSDLAATRQESLGVQPLDDFFRENSFEPAHAPGSNSRPKDGPHQCPIDMVWAPPHIMPESILDSFTPALSPLSDHAQLSWAVTTNLPPPLPRTRHLTNDDYGEWTELAFPALVKAFKLPTTDPTLLDTKAAAMVHAMEVALQPFTTLTRPSKTEVPWWTPSCGDLLKAIDAAPTNCSHAAARQAFKWGVRAAKCTYYSDQAVEANPSNIWAWAKQGLGTCPSQVPLLKHADGSFTQSDDEKGELFWATYFQEPPPLPDAGFGPLPPPPPGTPPLLILELMDVLADTSNLSALGPLGIGYCPLKWVITAFPDEILALFNDCLRLGHHPECWQAAKVVMLQKLNKKDPFSPHSYRPITLEETLGKLLKKMIANQLQFLTNTEDWLPPNQYGGCQGHSVYDTTQHLLQLVEGAHSTNQVCSILVVDIQGFFNSVHPQLLHQQLLTMGCPINMADWCLSFMMGHKVAISFDGMTTPLTPKPDLGTPQGSPASPILSTIFAGLVLHRFQ